MGMQRMPTSIRINRAWALAIEEILFVGGMFGNEIREGRKPSCPPRVTAPSPVVCQV